ncbi:MAG: hypothetical protein HN390_08690 [Anaerolineae bacterium]|jgi:hypothetical protein|nr:hypothetical protein [Anaerolineae bacterium]MBT7191030.1 hypothetical protein [Anaerolineae bacterium]MBT7990046.1 hypothetical protein [Anaerolineae bacterium]
MFTKPSQRFPLLFVSVAILLVAMWSGLLRVGWIFPTLAPWRMAHGPLMISGFLGTLISIERAVALNKSWLYTGPVLSAAGGIYYVAGGEDIIGALLMLAGSLGLVVIFIVILKQHREDYTVVMALGAVALFIGMLLWILGNSIASIVSWWSAFLVLTIVGERLELSRLMRPSKSRRIMGQITVGIYLLGLIFTFFSSNTGTRIASLGMLLMALWLLRFDIARFTIRKKELVRFVAVCLMSGYVWLGVGGLIGLYSGYRYAGPIYDAFLHTVFVGFTFSMIFGHAAIIFPSILMLPVKYSPKFYYPLALLHISLIMRIFGDLTYTHSIRLWGSTLNAIAILLFLMIMGSTIIKGRKEEIEAKKG